ncbi:bifunctional adenosylcobinamide kinase/adenosylcobinamide-phosphate guanylyltransferase [Clostridium sp. Marseille-P2415]|uniref:bifunctional adenosylcobinamide kinase/adenosylcobinamide-phosphate guanylyltransferase n=1 Tax=Clostridium sp. Marseille-P2415 TaxID=1805471 RepID=UPI0009887611|nr:bifunctional adenosylcobinamide kinase/adenosylcobinamide-phosphate guanylyltransferase [Clostridium sp. Marseille-P2415]
MILIIGGAWQGKLAFAMELAERHYNITADSGNAAYRVAEGGIDSYEAAVDCQIIHGFHEYIRRLLKEGKSVEAFLDTIEQQNPDAIIISDELGCGIVPADRSDREWREAAGRASVRLARTSKQVYRLVCGIATQIK